MKYTGAGAHNEGPPSPIHSYEEIVRCVPDCDIGDIEGGEDMFCCEGCNTWQHCKCEGLGEWMIPDHYFCSVCQPKHRPVPALMSGGKVKPAVESAAQGTESMESDSHPKRIGRKSKTPTFPPKKQDQVNRQQPSRPAIPSSSPRRPSALTTASNISSKISKTSETASKKRKLVDFNQNHDLRFQDIETVLLIVGSGKALFRVHKNLLIEKSGFFKVKLEKMRYKKGSEQMMEQVEEDEEIFDLFVQWLYEGKRSLPKLVGLEKDDTDLLLSVKLCVLAVALESRGLQNELMDRLVEAIDRETNYAPSLTVVSYVYSSVTRDNSAIRELMADWTGWQRGLCWLEENKRGELLQVPAFAAELVCSLKFFWKLPSTGSRFPREASHYDQ